MDAQSIHSVLPDFDAVFDTVYTFQKLCERMEIPLRRPGQYLIYKSDYILLSRFMPGLTRVPDRTPSYFGGP